MLKDAQGLAVTGSYLAVAALDRAIDDYYAWKGDPVGTLRQAVVADPSFSLGSSAVASLLSLGGFRGDHPEIVSALEKAEAALGGSTSREQRHLAAAKAWAAGEIAWAAVIWEDILLDHPTDALALRFAHDTYFYLGASLKIRDSVARVLDAWDTESPTYGYVLGQYAFGLEEAGELRRAEAVGRDAIARNPEDAWAVHAVAHVLETESRQTEGIEFLRRSKSDWSKAHALSVHNGWHLALYLIEEGRLDEVLVDYDRFVAPRLREDSLLDLVDASALLWRVELAGGDVGSRWAPLAAQWLGHVDEHVLVFNDLHLALAVARAGDTAGLERLKASLDRYVSAGGGDNRAITADVGRQLIEAVIAFADGAYGQAIDLILPVRDKVVRIGGSHAQRDLVTQTLIAAAERAGRVDLARALLEERWVARPTERTRQAYERVGGRTASHAKRAAVRN